MLDRLIWWLGAAHLVVYCVAGSAFVLAGIWNRLNSRLYGSRIILQWHFDRLKARRDKDRIVG